MIKQKSFIFSSNDCWIIWAELYPVGSLVNAPYLIKLYLYSGFNSHKAALLMLLVFRLLLATGRHGGPSDLHTSFLLHDATLPFYSGLGLWLGIEPWPSTWRPRNLSLSQQSSKWLYEFNTGSLIRLRHQSRRITSLFLNDFLNDFIFKWLYI